MKISIGFKAALAALSLLVAGSAFAQPIKIGLAEALTGPLSGGGKASLLATRMWVEDVNAKGGMLGRKVELIVYDDQSGGTLTPGIYTKLLDVDKVDLLFAPYATVPTAPIMPLVKQRGLLLMGNFSIAVNETVHHDMWFNNAPWPDAKSQVDAYMAVGKRVGVKTIAFLAADQEFAQNVLKVAKVIAPKDGLKIVYEQTYPPNTVDFSSMMQALRAAKPEMVYVLSYPGDTAAIVRAVNEIGVGDSVKIFGGGMVGLQYAPLLESLGSGLNGIVNYNSYVPEKTMIYPGVQSFLERYAKKAAEEKVDPLGFYLPPFAYATGQMTEQAVNGTKSLDQKKIAQYLHTHEMQTIVGPIRYNAIGERAVSGVLMTQLRGVADHNVEQFRSPGHQVILEPVRLKTGELIAPFEKARKG
jgi:branched-chain amino acid transport system substrate-binding protein